MDTKYNGWTNYATWLVNLHLFSDLNIDDVVDNIEDITPEWVLEYIDYMVFEDNDNTELIIEFAKAILRDVNCKEIAESLIDNYNG
jgi:hypothetical protein